MPWRNFLYVAILVFIPFALVSAQEERIVVLANSVDYELANSFFSFFKATITVIHATTIDFDQYKSEKFIVILGGPDAYEGIGGITKEVLTNDEENWLRIKGNRNMYPKTNLWTEGQVVIVLAGSDRYQTEMAHEEHIHEVREEAENTLQVNLKPTPPSYTPPPPPA
jgi:hypothetical protein